MDFQKIKTYDRIELACQYLHEKYCEKLGDKPPTLEQMNTHEFMSDLGIICNEYGVLPSIILRIFQYKKTKINRMDKDKEPRAKDALEIFNKITGRKFRETPQNHSVIKARLGDGYSMQDITEVIINRYLEWKDSPIMAVHICPKTIFRSSNFEKYFNEVLMIRQNPNKYKKHYEQLNKTESNDRAFGKIDQMFGGK